MKIVKTVFKYLGLVICALFSMAICQLPTLEETPVFSVNSQAEFNEAMRSVNLSRNILLFILFAIIAFIGEWYFCKLAGNKIAFNKKVNMKGMLLAIAGGIISFIFAYIISRIVKSNGFDIMTATLRSKLAILLILGVVVVGPIVEELCFQGGIQKGIFKRLNPWISILLTAIIFAIFHNADLDIFFLDKVLDGIIFGYVYQKTDDIKMPILSHSILNFLITVFAYL